MTMTAIQERYSKIPRFITIHVSLHHKKGQSVRNHCDTQYYSYLINVDTIKRIMPYSNKGNEVCRIVLSQDLSDINTHREHTVKTTRDREWEQKVEGTEAGEYMHRLNTSIYYSYDLDDTYDSILNKLSPRP